MPQEQPAPHRPTGLPGVALRAIADTDRWFLHELYASTRTEEMTLVDWPPEQKARFLRSQFEAQHRHYQQHYPTANFDLILLDTLPVGRLYVHRQPHDIRIVDITLLPQHRANGIGGALLQLLMAEARAADCPLSVHVEVFNPARRLYERLGFTEHNDLGVYKLLRWRASRE